MASNTISFLNSAAERTVAEVVSGLSSFDTINGRFRVSLPIVMPSGGLIDVSVYPEPGGSYLVSDEGVAFAEAAGYGVLHRSFAAIAKVRAARAGAVFDGNALMFMRVRSEQLRVAIISIGNLSAEVATDLVERSIKTSASGAREKLFETIDKAFPGKPVAHDVDIYGASTASYQFDALVEMNGSSVAFDIFTKDPVSIAATYTKLSDVSRMEDNPALVGVTTNPDNVGPKLALISSVARVIRLDAPVDTFRKAAA